MENNQVHKIAPADLDGLLGKVFLDLDFEKQENRKILNAVTSRYMDASPVNGVIKSKSYLRRLLFILIGSAGLAAGLTFFYQAETAHPPVQLFVPATETINKSYESTTPASATHPVLMKTIPETQLQPGNFAAGTPGKPVKSISHGGRHGARLVADIHDDSIARASATREFVAVTADTTRDLSAADPARISSAPLPRQALTKKNIARREQNKPANEVKKNNKVKYAVRKKRGLLNICVKCMVRKLFRPGKKGRAQTGIRHARGH
jgi:hypothetical protein